MNLRFHNEVSIPLRKATLKGDLVVPLRAEAVIIFAHGSGSSRLSTRNRLVARYLNQHQFGTLLFDLLTEEEDDQYFNRFDIDLLTKRLIGATEWLESHPAVKDCSFGYFGASTGAASALRASEYLPHIGAVVSRGGRPDLAGTSVLQRVETPTLFIVGSMDAEVLHLNQKAFDVMSCDKKLEIVPGATHLFEETGAMEKVAELSTAWFRKYLQPTHAGSRKFFDILL